MFLSSATSRLVARSIITRRTRTLSACLNNGRLLSTEPDDESAVHHRNPNIQVHPDSLMNKIEPGGELVVKKSDIKGGEDRLIKVERALGYFWMMQDLQLTNSKPILSDTEKLIPELEAEVFPVFTNLNVLSNDEEASIPDFCLRKNRSKDPNAQCTLLTIAYKDHGAQSIVSWVDPFRVEFDRNDRVEVISLSVTEGSFVQVLLGRFLKASMKSNVPKDQQDTTLVYFGDELVGFRDTLRMNNTLAGYIFLLDGIGRIRFCGSGKATEDEISALIRFTRQLLPNKQKSSRPSSRQRKKDR